MAGNLSTALLIRLSWRSEELPESRRYEALSNIRTQNAVISSRAIPSVKDKALSIMFSARLFGLIAFSVVRKSIRSEAESTKK